ncbi:MAG TPA: DUF72 domain-containing protein [Planctomycetota bacterium]|nr:DUF72 domain-containing protein [Planctomycetota bacterium]
MPTARIGTSGWNYRHWRTRFYPEDVPVADWLPWFAARFATVELNTTFYGIPAPTTTARWPTRVPRGFRFAVKLWKGITHYKRLKDCGAHLERFFAAVEPLGAARGPLLVQLPGRWHRDAARLDSFLRDARSAASLRWRIAVEVRDPDWVHPEIYRVLDRHGAAMALADLPKCPVIEPNDAPLVYVRRHGPHGGYRANYPPERLAADAAAVARWLGEGRDCWCYYNNDIDGCALDDATALADQVGAPWPRLRRRRSPSLA